jgi:tRNA-specific 2-thiouridylase
VDPKKDQSYFLYRLAQRELRHLLFPIGGLGKREVRGIASSKGLPESLFHESQDICFIKENSYRSLVSEPDNRICGEITDIEGNVLGNHRGLAMYTIGQRQGLGLSSGKRLHVLELDTKTNRVIVGTKDRLVKRRLIAGSISWVSGSPPSEMEGITARIRHGAEESPVVFHLRGNKADVLFSKPQIAVTPGQDIIFYRNSEVLGGGVIEKGLA